jgi:Icc-related predicted phosphoesterase
MKIVCFSDTHNYHKNVILPECDIVIFAGDFSSRGSKEDTESFIKWFTSQTQCRHKVMIAGNHDLCFDPVHNLETGANTWLVNLLKAYNVGTDFHVLEDSSIEIEGIKIWGSPITPDFYPQYWAFNKPREELLKFWASEIQTDADIIVTHGPAYLRGDKTVDGINTGCPGLLRKIEEMKPKYHISGHIHEGRSISTNDHTTFINCCICDERYNPVGKPIEFEI